ncbi:pyruvate kinase [Arcanobacterium haemolyticum]|uniref:Pyruvate kinase n=1 Tax=Arcanobacterium haemolyticum (strain ATCC 9345 / DSM 20595 / CCM 5947 / CCUG 17215 / LMG 16163 / NBRC 15585 / NCTC 8452 / 11018) TaxID=644284 RepID=D7BNX5_ARCHD|nr:pyruvate kinase [Arcanobacterium haemolyticum]ADH92624.1 pyruvate kinase [Arcanobacterium haemolyticum DSM 20595]QCX46736.1 pyruvate kinase [Arcanobacterium haemolyticum]SPT74397.1 Pyruvate kinase [Arcanobacterium haemolyticum]SQH28641.1 Pyruvate kinase [Arcanobacterium haemolyticum]
MRRAKIVCTLGPAVNSKDQILELVKAGMNVARINASHGSHEEHEERIDWVRQASEELRKPVAVLVDLQGPKIRLGRFAEGPVLLNTGDIFTITTDDIQGDKDRVSTTFKGLPGDCSEGDLILIDDGKVQVRVLSVEGNDVRTQVLVGGTVSNNKGVNLPGVAVSVPALSEKDKEDLEWGLEYGADLIALSFVRSPKDIDDVHEVMDRVGRRIPVIAKIEKPQAVNVLEDIVRAFDGLMVARGDLGVELPLQQVPIVQKHAISIARRNAKPVIVATQVLESMISAPTPTRAETSDCANAILDGADAVMLSGETSVGKYPIICVQTMASIIEYTEEHGIESIPRIGNLHRTRNGVITRSAMDIGEAIGVKFIAVFTSSGQTARRMSRLRGRIPLVVFTDNEQVRRQLALSWGLDTLTLAPVSSTDEMVDQVDDVLRKEGLAVDGDRVVIVSGMPPGVVGSTNTIRIHKMGETRR